MKKQAPPIRAERPPPSQTINRVRTAPPPPPASHKGAEARAREATAA